MYAHFLTLLCALRLAPLLQSSTTTSEWPPSAAAIRGVNPIYQSKSATLDHSYMVAYKTQMMQ